MSGVRVCPECGFPMTLVETGVVRRPGRADYAQVGLRCIDTDCPGHGREVVDAADSIVRSSTEESVD